MSRPVIAVIVVGVLTAIVYQLIASYAGITGFAAFVAALLVSLAIVSGVSGGSSTGDDDSKRSDDPDFGSGPNQGPDNHFH